MNPRLCGIERFKSTHIMHSKTDRCSIHNEGNPVLSNAKHYLFSRSLKPTNISFFMTSNAAGNYAYINNLSARNVCVFWSLAKIFRQAQVKVASDSQASTSPGRFRFLSKHKSRSIQILRQAQVQVDSDS